MTFSLRRAVTPLVLASLLASCVEKAEKKENPEKAEAAGAASEGGKAEAGSIKLTADQIRTAAIEVVRPNVGGNGGTIELPATIEGNPEATQVVSAAIAGRVVSLTRNLGETVRRGEPLAVIESREAASLKGEVVDCHREVTRDFHRELTRVGMCPPVRGVGQAGDLAFRDLGAAALLALKRKLSFPVSRMWQ